MLIDPKFDEFFKTTLRSLTPYLEDVVCIGGCANALYRHHEAATPIELGYLGTHDVDFAIKPAVPIRDGHSIAQIMLESGLKEELFGSDADAVVKYCPIHSTLAVDVEFLCGASGLRGTRKGRDQPVSYDVQEGLKAQPLQYLELLLHRPWQVDLGRVPGFSDVKGLVVRVPTPLAYVVQKVLIRKERRKPESMAKDCYYMFEISALFRDALDRLALDFAQMSSAFPANWFRTFHQEAGRLFRDEYAEGPVSAMKIHRDMPAVATARFSPNEKIVSLSVMKLLDRMKNAVSRKIWAGSG